MIIRQPPTQTRISLKTDTTLNWQKSDLQLREGEVAISYDKVFDKNSRMFEKRNFQIRIGKQLENGRYSTWRESPQLQASQISEDLKLSILEHVKNNLKDFFVQTTYFEDVMREVKNKISAMNERLNTRVGAYVKNESLFLTTDNLKGIVK